MKQPTFAFGLKTQKDFEKLAITLEDTGVSAYNGAAPMIKSTEVLAAAGSIVQVEARHAAALRFLGEVDPTQGPLRPDTVRGRRPEGRQAAHQACSERRCPAHQGSGFSPPPRSLSVRRSTFSQLTKR